MSATEMIIDICRTIDREAKSAENRFDFEAQSIERDASQPIDLFGGSATSEALKLTMRAREASDELYTTYQSLVERLDKQCSPLLSENPDTVALVYVFNLMKWLNDESAIENNFSASLNSHDFGQFASVKYSATLENKMLQKKWEQEAKSRSDYNSASKEYQSIKRKEAEDKRRKEAEAREKIRKDKERRKQQHEKKYAKRKEAIQKWLCEYDAVNMTRKRVLSSALKEKRRELEAQAHESFTSAKTGNMDMIDALKAEQQNYEEELRHCGLFALSDKRALKKLIKSNDAEIQKCLNSIKHAQAEYDNKYSEIERKLDLYKQNAEKHINQEYPYPNKPAEANLTNSTLADTIVDMLYAKGEMSFKDIVEELKTFNVRGEELSSQTVSAALRKLRMGIRVSMRTDYRGNNYFSAEDWL